MKAMVIDDSTAVRTILKRILTEAGFQVAESSHGKEALELLKKNGPVEVALVDWNMPEMNGYDFIQAVRALKEYDDMRLMMVTTETEIAQVAKALEAGANEYLMKPFTREMVLEKLKLLGVSLP